MKKEIWKEIEGHDGDYFISNYGRVKSFKKCRGINEKILVPCEDSYGYFQIKLYKNGMPETKLIHVLMFENFNDYKLKKNECIHHIDKNEINNILDNFQLMTKSEHNSFHNKGKKYPEHSKRMKGENNPSSVLTERNVIEIRKLCDEELLTQREIAEKFGVNRVTISNIKTRKTWSKIKGVY